MRASRLQTVMTDYLTQLPAELFHKICEFAYRSRGPYLALVSKAFVPFARGRLFGGNVCVQSSRRFAKLIDVLASSPGAAATVKKLSVTTTTTDTGQPETKTFVKALSNMTRLRTLDIQAASRLCEAALSPPPQGCHLPSLAELVIKSPLHGWSNPFSPANYHSIGNYPTLEGLKLHVERKVSTLGRYSRPSPAMEFPPRLRWLHLAGFLAGNPAVKDLIDSLAPGATLALQVHDGGARGALAALLDSLARPTSLSALSLEQDCAFAEDLSTVLPRFTRLKGLELSRGIAFTPFLPVLVHLPNLTTLWFCSGAIVAGEDLLALFRGPYKLEHLRRLTIDVALWTRWSEETFDRFERDMVTLVEICETGTVKLDGTAVRDARCTLKARREREEREKQEEEARKRDGPTPAQR
ncbi:hypothetical protein JCM10449v2_007846 [Rhodotorula kratochvilovae]